MIPRCSACPCVPRRSPVPPSGPSPCRFLFIGEAPSKHEDALLIPFIGDAGRELNDHYLPLAGLDRSCVAIANSVWCSQPSYRNPRPEEAYICSQKHLPSLLAQLNPEIIVLMGAIACSLFPSISLNLHHGFPQPGSYADWEGILFPTFHPAAGLHGTAYMIPLRQDMQVLGRLIKSIDEGTFEWPSDPYPNPDYSVIREPVDLLNYLRESLTADQLIIDSSIRDISWLMGQISIALEIATDTETHPDGSPYCLTLSILPGTGRLIYSRDKNLIERYACMIRHLNPLLHFHNYLFDVNPYEKMCIPIPRFLDTMVRAYELCLGGGGDEEDSGGRGSLSLKVLAYRHLHMRMRTFKETVLPHTLPHVTAWLSSVSSLLSADSIPICECSHKRASHAPRGKSGRLLGPCQSSDCLCLHWKLLKRPKAKEDKSMDSLSRKVNSLFKGLSAGENPSKPIDPWGRVKGWNEGELSFLEGLVGPFPALDIAQVPEDELVAYAVRDADATGRLSRYLNTIRLRV